MRLGRTVLAGGILFTTYEWVAALIQPMLEKKLMPAVGKVD
jgi:hypothetical protein